MESTSTSPTTPESDSPSTNEPTLIQPSTPSTSSVVEPSAETSSSVAEPSPAPGAASVLPLEQPAATVITPTTPVEPAAASFTAAAASEPQPVAVAPLESASPNPSRPPRAVPWKKLILVGVGVLLLLVTGASSYLLGEQATKTPTMSTTAQQTAMTVPKDATVIEQCSPGFGTQYILPKDIPGGPVYNVYQGKLIGIEYMTALTSSSNPDLMLKDLPLFAQKYDHVDIMTMPAHAGFPSPHYQVDVMMVPTAVSSKITCGSSSDSTSHSTMDSMSNSTTNSSTSHGSNMSM